MSHISFEIKGKEKIGIIGRNGAGKTTLLRLIAGELSLDRDDKREGPGIRTDRRLSIGMLSQTGERDQEKTVEQIVLEGCPPGDAFSRERYEFELEYDRIFTGLGFAKKDKEKRFGEFSGGEQTKIALIRLLLRKPDILLLDEPTNHLDMASTEWLEDYLKDYSGAVAFVSHDRFFLDQIASVIYELRDGELRRYAGNYTSYRTQKQKEILLGRKAYERQQKEIERLNELIEKFKHKPRKASFARSRKTLLQRMEKLPAPREDEAHIFTGEILPLFPANKWVYEAKELSVGYEKALFTLSLRVKNGQKIGIIGENGAGKTALLKTIAGYLPPLGGKGNLGEKTLLGYFDQQSAALDSDKTVAEHFHELFPALTEKEVRQTLGAYLFSGKAANVKVRALSGGEKARLVLAEILCSRPNVLLLDEPTNHMDIHAKETLESAFRAYKGTILFVSHDRYFISQVADSILVLSDRGVMYYPFGYEHYIERKRKSSGEKDMTALIRAEDQALLAGIRAVPEKEKHRLREIGTEEAYRDWQLRLRAEELNAAEENVRKEAARLEMLEEEQARAGDYGKDTEESTVSRKTLSELEEHWTEACLAWYDALLYG